MADSNTPAGASPKAVGVTSIVVVAVVLLALLLLTTDDREFYWAAGVGLLLGLVVALVFVILLFKRLGLMSSQQMVKENNQAVELLEQNRIVEASAAFEKLVAELEPTSPVHAVAMMNLGVTYLRQGVVEGALRAYERVVIEHPKLEKGAMIYGETLTQLRARLAEGHALQGNLVESRRWFDQAWQKEVHGLAGLLLGGELTCMLKQERFQDAAAHAESHWWRAEASCRGHGFKAVRILRAFALSKLEASDERTKQIRILLEGCWPAGESEFAYLAYHWPAMAAFLETHGMKTPEALRTGKEA